MPHTTPNDSCPTPKATPIDASRIGLPPDAQGLARLAFALQKRPLA